MLTGFKPITEAKGTNVTVILGPQSTGKTTLGATWPKPLGIYSINDDGGLIVLKNRYKGQDVSFLAYTEKAENVNGKPANVGYINAGEKDEIKLGVTNAVECLKTRVLAPLEALPREKQPFKTLIIESYADLETSLVKSHQLRKEAKLSLTEMKTLVGDPLLILRDRIYRFASEKDVKVICITHIKWKEINRGLTDDLLELKCIPNMTENNGGRVMHKADLVIYTDTVNYTYDDGKTTAFGYVAFLGAHPFVTAKFRTSPTDENSKIPVGVMIPSPTYDKITDIRNRFNNGEDVKLPVIVKKTKKEDN